MKTQRNDLSGSNNVVLVQRKQSSKRFGKVICLTAAILFGIIASISQLAAQGSTIYVSATTGGSSRSADGSKEKPYKDLQVAIDKAEPEIGRAHV